MRDNPEGRYGRGMSIALLLVLMILVAVLVIWAWQDTPPDAPSVPATAVPDRVPHAAPPGS
ncbi:MAG: hypothetical protein ACK4K7_04730 [Allosphingosinicella sp.]|uniref:hypothetical protein n=1 Tax=Allosphingosinicella sp. TaxID=2823234 RepID=UPI003949C98B